MVRAALDWSQCSAVESVPGKRFGAWVFRGTRTPVSVVFDNLEVGASIDEITEWFHLSREQVVSVIRFASRSLDAQPISSALREGWAEAAKKIAAADDDALVTGEFGNAADGDLVW